MLAQSRNPILKPQITAATIEQQFATLPHLTQDRRVLIEGTRHKCRDARKAEDAAAAIGKLPGPNQTLHLAIGGKFALWHVVPAVVALTGRPIRELRIATLGFSRANIDELCQMIDAGQIGSAWLLCSLYFKGTSSEIFHHAREEIAKRPGRAFFAAIRTHAKILLMKLDRGRTITVESSANLRSCKNIEQMTVIGAKAVYDFHAGWIDQLFAAGDRPLQTVNSAEPK